MSQPYIEDLPAYFTEVKDPCSWFRGHVDAKELRERLLVIHGIGGSGKSSLLRMFRMYCRGIGTPVALTSGDRSKSASDILRDWANDLKADDVTLPAFAQTLKRYDSIQTAAGDPINRTPPAVTDSEKLVGLRKIIVSHFDIGELRTLCFDLGIDYDDLPGEGKSDKARELVALCERHGCIDKLRSKVRELRQNASWDDTQTASPRVPSDVLGGMSGAAYEDSLRGQDFAERDIDLNRDPTKQLTDDFLADIEQVASENRLVLMLDTFEKLSAVEGWARDLAKQLHQNVLLVIAGQVWLDWEGDWPGWREHTHIEDLKPMTYAVMREVIFSYYYSARKGEGELKPMLVEEIIRFARGLPVAVTTAAHCCSLGNTFEDFEMVKSEALAKLVKRFKNNVPKEITTGLEAAATVRWFNKEILRDVMELMDVMESTDVNQVYEELQRLPFVHSHVGGFAVHDIVRKIIDDDLCAQEPRRQRDLHERVATYFKGRMEKCSGDEAKRFELEILYHRVRADEKAGIEEFQKKAEELTQYRFVDRLRALLNDTNTYPLEYENSRLWKQYYGARLAHLEARFTDAEKAYQETAGNKQAESKLRAYARCDWGTLMTGEYKRLNAKGAIDKTVDILKKSLEFEPWDLHLSGSLFSLARIARGQGDWVTQNKYLEDARSFFEEQQDQHGIATVHVEMRRAYARRGLWKDFIKAHECAEEALSKVPQPAAAEVLRMKLLGDWGWSFALAGRPAKCVENARRALEIADELKDDVSKLHALRDLAWGLGAQDRFADSAERFSECLAIIQQRKLAVEEKGSILGFWGAVLGRKGDHAEAQGKLEESLQIKDKDRERDIPGIQEPLIWLGLALELQGKWDEAEKHYQQNQKYKQYRHYFDATALTGLIRIKYAQGNYAAIPSLLEDAERLAKQYEYNDHLSSLRLTQGHIAWDGYIPEWGSGFDATLLFYQQALIYALRYNRFLLDEVLSGRPQGTPLRPIIAHCRERGEEGRRMLRDLRDWWQKGVNDIGTPRPDTMPDTISLIREGIPLLVAEDDALRNESGDRLLPRKKVTKQIDDALSRQGPA